MSKPVDNIVELLDMLGTHLELDWIHEELENTADFIASEVIVPTHSSLSTTEYSKTGGFTIYLATIRGIGTR